MTTLPIVEHFNVLEDILFCFLSREIAPVVDGLLLERTEETLDAGFVPAVAFVAHRTRDAVIREQSLVVVIRRIAPRDPSGAGAPWPIEFSHPQCKRGTRPGQQPPS